MKKIKTILTMAMLTLAWPFLQAQPGTDSFSIREVSSIMTVLAGDSLEGRGNGTTALSKAAVYIGQCFRLYGLKPLPGTHSFYLPFMRFRTDTTLVTVADNDSLYAATGYNVVAVLPGRSRANEAILFSAHYDHVGILSEKRSRDSIMNGANDNASGTAALMLLAKYFSLRNDNERTLIFCAFSGEEIGLKGSSHFVEQINPEAIVAAINLEMLGIPQYGTKRVFITGYWQSSLPKFLSKRLRAAGVKTVHEPDQSKDLFMRSDNYPLAMYGVPAHTIMASDDDDECYHKPCDELKRIDISNLVELAKAIAAASSDLVNGKETPSRIK